MAVTGGNSKEAYSAPKSSLDLGSFGFISCVYPGWDLLWQLQREWLVMGSQGRLRAKDMTGHTLRTLTQANVLCHYTGKVQHRQVQVLLWDYMVCCSGSL